MHILGFVERQPVEADLPFGLGVELEMRHRPPGAARERFFALARVLDGDPDLLRIELEDVDPGPENRREIRRRTMFVNMVTPALSTIQNRPPPLLLPPPPNTIMKRFNTNR